jgi:hypothetical protein
VSFVWTNGMLSAGSPYCTIPFHARNCIWSLGGRHTWGDARGFQFLERHWRVATFEFSFLSYLISIMVVSRCNKLNHSKWWNQSINQSSNFLQKFPQA